MAQQATRPEPDVEEAEEITISDEQWEEMLREAGARVKELTVDEARAIFDSRTRQVMGISGDEFIRRYDAGEFDHIPDDADHTDFMWLVMSMPLGR